MTRSAVALLAILTACSSSPATDSTAATTTSAPTSTSTTTLATTTTPPPTTTTTTVPLAEQAWSETDAERWVTDYLAALAAGAFEQAAWSAENNGIVLDGQADDELPTQFLRRSCQGDACAGPYTVEAQGPGLVDGLTAQASSKVVVTHEPSGQSTTLRLGTFEGGLFIQGLPPLVPSEPVASLVEQLFGPSIPDHVVVGRLDAFEIWTDGAVEWVTNWWADGAYEVEGGWASVFHPAGPRLVSIFDPATTFDTQCPRLISRNGVPLVFEQCWSDSWRLLDPATGEELPTPVPAGPGVDGGYVTFTERASTVVTAIGDAEGNLTAARTLAGVDLLGDAYAGVDALSVDGAHYAFVDHADPASFNHFWSPVIVVVDTATGREAGRWVLEQAIGCVEFAIDWLVVCEVDSHPMEPVQVALSAINIDTAEVRRVETLSRVFLPVPASG